MNLDKIIKIVRNLNEEGPTVGKRKKRPPIIARGLLPGARKRWSGGM